MLSRSCYVILSKFVQFMSVYTITCSKYVALDTPNVHIIFWATCFKITWILWHCTFHYNVWQEKNLKCIIGPWMCVKQNVACNSFQVLSYTCSGVIDTWVFSPCTMTISISDITCVKQKPHNVTRFKFGVIHCMFKGYCYMSVYSLLNDD